MLNDYLAPTLDQINKMNKKVKINRKRKKKTLKTPHRRKRFPKQD